MDQNMAAATIFQKVQAIYQGSGYNAMDAMKEADRLCSWGCTKSYDGSLAIYRLPGHLMILGSPCGLSLVAATEIS